MPKELQAFLVEVTLFSIKLEASFFKCRQHSLEVAVMFLLDPAINYDIIQVILDPLEVFQHKGAWRMSLENALGAEHSPYGTLQNLNSPSCVMNAAALLC